MEPTYLDNAKALQQLDDEMLQAQVLVAIDKAQRTTRRHHPPNATLESIRYIATPHTPNKRTLLLVWTLAIAAPVPLLVEYVEHGGYVALLLAALSVFLVVPRLTRASRNVYVLTDRRAFVSRRTMYCTVETTQLYYADIYDAELTADTADGATATLDLRGRPESTSSRAGGGGMRLGAEARVRFANVRDVEGLCRVIQRSLPAGISVRVR